MKNGKSCPKCNSKDILRIEGAVGAFGAGDNIPAGKTIFSYVKVTRYLCSSCGFIEEWIDSTEGLQTLKTKYGRATA
jgi:hypothetical protein